MLSKLFANIEGHLTQQKKADVSYFVLILEGLTCLSGNLPKLSEANYA
jgi:hypothetical protein